MCVSDFRLGARIRSVVSTQSLAINDRMDIGGNLARVGLVFSTVSYFNATANAPALFCNNDAITLIHQGQQTYTVDIRTHGDLVIKPWHIVTTAGAAGVFSIIELLLDEATLASHWDEFRRRY